MMPRGMVVMLSSLALRHKEVDDSKARVTYCGVPQTAPREGRHSLPSARRRSCATRAAALQQQ